jgi:hypothetical protein
MSERRAIRVNQTSIIQYLINNQACSLQKAILEAVQNAIDADATRIDITIDHGQLIIADDGFGIRSREEIEKVFEELAFTHDDRTRQLGRFGLGRAQLWAYAATTWRTNTFAMDVDVRTHGENYDLRCDLPHQPGMTITGRLYEPLDEYQRVTAVRELERLCRYAPIPVFVNGQRLGSDPAERRWTKETDEAYLQVNETSTLDVYNVGIFVRSYSRSEFGVGGVIVTKRGHPLNLSISRTEVAESACPLWKRLRAEVRALAATLQGRERMTDAQREYLASRLIGPEADAAFAAPIITILPRRHITVDAFVRAVSDVGSVTVQRREEHHGETIARSKRAVVLAEATLHRFGVTSVAGLVDRLVQAYKASPKRSEGAWRATGTFQRVKVSESLREGGFLEKVEYTTVNDSALKDSELAVLRALRRSAGESITWTIGRHHPSRLRPQERRLLAGEGPEGTQAWTDGHSAIWISRKTLSRALTGGPGAMATLLGILVHEYLHNDSDAGSHEHDEAFHEAAHEILIEGAGDLWRMAGACFETAYKLVTKPSPSQAKHKAGLDRVLSTVATGEAVRAAT